MKKFLLALLLATPVAYADYPTCDPNAADNEISCPVCFEADNPAIEDAPADQQIVCVAASDET